MTVPVTPAVPATGAPATGEGADPAIAAEFATLLAAISPNGGEQQHADTEGEPAGDGTDPQAAVPGEPVAGAVPVPAVLLAALPALVPTGQPGEVSTAPDGPGTAAASVASPAAVVGQPAAPSAPGTTQPATPAPAAASGVPVPGQPTTAASPATTPAAAVEVADAPAAASPEPGPVEHPDAPSAPVTSSTSTVGRPVPVVTTGPALTLTPAPTGRDQTAPLPGQVAAHVGQVVARGDGSYAMTVQAHPADLGPVNISVRVHDGTVEVAMASVHEHARAVLTEAAPSIRRELAVAGLVCDRVNVNADLGSTGQDYRPAGQDAQMADRGPDQGPQQDRRARTGMDTGEPHETQTPALVKPQTAPSGVDVRV